VTDAPAPAAVAALAARMARHRQVPNGPDPRDADTIYDVSAADLLALPVATLAAVRASPAADVPVRRRALRGLVRPGDAAARAALRAALDDPDRAVRGEAWSCLEETLGLHCFAH